MCLLATYRACTRALLSGAVASRPVMNLDTIPTPAPDCTPWRNVSLVGDGWYRLFDNGTRIQYAYPDGRTWSAWLTA